MTFICVLALGCDGSATRDHPILAPGTAGSVATTSVSPSLKAKLLAHDRVRDPKNWALFAEQTPPAGYRDIHRTAASFDVEGYDEVRAYYHGFDAWHWNATSVDDVKGCSHRAVAPDGTLCPTVVLPGVDIGVARGRALASLFNAQRPSAPRVVMCVAQPQLAFVYSRRGVPIGEIEVDVHCPRWEAAPGFDESFQSSATREAVVRLCRDAGLFLCDPETPEDQQALQLWKAANVEPLPKPLNQPESDWRRKPRPLPVPGRSVLSRLSEHERRELCVWNVQHVGIQRAPGRDHAGVILDGTAGILNGGALAWPECVKRFPACSRTVGEVAPCMDKAQRGDIWFTLPENAHCKPLRDCIWGFETTGLQP